MPYCRGGELVGFPERQVEQDPVVQRDDGECVQIGRPPPDRHVRFATLRRRGEHRIVQRLGIAEQPKRLMDRPAVAIIVNQHRREPVLLGIAANDVDVLNGAFASEPRREVSQVRSSPSSGRCANAARRGR